MHMKDDHMRNAQLKSGYNVQIAADSEYIAATVPGMVKMYKKLGFTDGGKSESA